MASNNTRVIVGMVIGIAVVAAVVLALKWAMSENATPGTPIGRVDLVAPKPSAQFEIPSGATLHTRIEAVFETGAGGPTERKRDLDDRLRSSQLILELLDASGTRQETTCAVYTGSGEQGDITSTTIAKSMVNDCTLAVRSGGRHVLTARVQWAAGLVVSSATLDIRSVAR